MVSNGRLKSALSRKACTKTLLCTKTVCVCEELERLELEGFFSECMNYQISPDGLFRFIQECARERLNLVLQDASTLNIIEQFNIYHDKVREAHIGKKAVVCLSVMDQQHLVFTVRLPPRQDSSYFAFSERITTWFASNEQQNLSQISPNRLMMGKSG